MNSEYEGILKEKSLKSNMLWNSFGSLYYSGCQWLITVVVARLSSNYEAAGLLAVAMSVSNVFSQIGLFRIRSYQVSDIHERVSASQYVGFRLTTIFLGIIATYLYMYFTCSRDGFVVISLYLVFRAGDVFIDVLHGVDQQHLRMDYCGISMIIRATLFLVAFIIGMTQFDSLNVALIGMVAVTYPMILFDYKIASQFTNVRPSFDTAVIKHLFMSCLPAVVGMSLCSVVVTYSRQYLGECYGASALGIYATVCTPIVIIQACATYVYAPLLGSFAKRYEAKDVSGLFRLVFKVTISMFAVFAVFACVFMLFGSELLNMVFGGKIAGYCYLIYAGLFSSAFTALVAFLSDLLIGIRDMSGCFIGNCIGCLISFPLAWFLIPRTGLNGASYVVIISYFISCAILFYFLFKAVHSIAIDNSAN